MVRFTRQGKGPGYVAVYKLDRKRWVGDSVISDVGFVTMCAKQAAKRVRRIVRIINDENGGQMWIRRSILTPIPCIV